ncbi:MAG: DedA family protein [Longimicrobiales bacterium]
MLARLWTWLAELPPEWLYLALGAGAAVENVLPAVPADTFVLLGGFLSAMDPDIRARWVFLATWLLNVASALLMYRFGHTHGRGFFEHGWGRRLLNPHQMERMEGFYRRWGLPAIFLTRFLPGLRSVVPVFAGVTHRPFLGVAVPIVAASAIWYGVLVWAGVQAGRNLDRVRAVFESVNGVLLGAAAVVALAVGVWWWRTRRHDG